MEKRTLGKTGRQISVMGYGCGGFWGQKLFSEAKAIRLVHRAIDQGVNFFDTGASYSGGNAELRLGKALKGRDTSNLIVGTKAGTVLRGRRLFKDYSKASILGQVDSSLTNLGLDSLPLLQLHGMPKENLEDVVLTLDSLKQQGKAQMIGASCDGEALERALSVDQLDVVMMTYNLIEKQPLRQISRAYARGCGILIKSPMCHTLYANDIFKIRRLSDIWYLLRVFKNYREQLREGRKYRFINDVEGWTSHEIALLYALHEKVSCVVTGTTNETNMDRNIAAMSRTLPDELRNRISKV